MSTAVPEAQAGRFVGKPVLRREDPRLLTGHGQYVDDINLAGQLHAVFVRSPFARAKIVSIDATAARELEGVHAVYSAKELHEGLNPFPAPGPVNFPEMYPLAVDDVRFVGDPVVMILAENRYIAEDAAELVDIEYEPLPAVVGNEADEEGAEVVHPDFTTNRTWEAATDPDPELDAVFANADHVIEETFRQQRHTNVPMETRGAIGDWHRGSQELTMHVSSQMPHNWRMGFSAMLGVPEHKVRVTMKDVGGGFGGKIFVSREDVAVAAASRRSGRPVKWIEDRQENLMASNHARDEWMHVKMAVSKDGIIQGAHINHVENIGAYPLMVGGGNGSLVTMMFPGVYKMGKYGYETHTFFSNTCGRGAYRGPWMYESVARECMMDIVARELGMDPAEFRRKNIIQPDELPHTTAAGVVYDNVSLSETLEMALDMAGYDAFKAEQEAARKEGRYLGMGISAYIEPTAMGAGAFGIEVAEIRIEPTGKVNVLMGTGSHGQSLETTIVQVVADQLGVDIEDVILLQGDTSNTPFGGGTAGSRSGVTASNAARKSAQTLREKVLAIAAHMLEANPDDLEINMGTINVAGSSEPSVTMQQVAMAAYMNPAALPEGMDLGLENTARWKAPPFTFSNATHVCKVEVDTGTGMVKILDFVVSEDCGVMINPNVVDGQVAGGVAQGIGGVLLESAPYDSEGNPLAITFKDYLMPTTDTVVDYRIGHIETRGDNEIGSKGTGEGGTIGAPAAVVNAVIDALSPFGIKRLPQLPLDPTRILQEIEGRTPQV
jgi:carbon-monoxide dehydrogenase large subunit